MIEYHTVKHIDNSRLVRPTSPERLQDFWRRVAAGAAMATCLLVYTWQHFECIQLRYEVEQLESLRAQSSVLNQQLHVEVDTLSAPDRVYSIAGKELGLTVPVVGQAPTVAAESDGVLAEARPVSQNQRP
jgi:cell division protein FtsL